MSPSVALWVTRGVNEKLTDVVSLYTKPAALEVHHENEVLERLSELNRMHPLKAWSISKTRRLPLSGTSSQVVGVGVEE